MKKAFLIFAVLFLLISNAVLADDDDTDVPVIVWGTPMRDLYKTEAPSPLPEILIAPTATAVPTEAAAVPTEAPAGSGMSFWDLIFGSSKKTAVPTATKTPEPTATDTPMPTATDTPEPTATDTPVPVPTEEPADSGMSFWELLLREAQKTAAAGQEPAATGTSVPTATDMPTYTPVPVETEGPVVITGSDLWGILVGGDRKTPSDGSGPKPTDTAVPTNTAAPLPTDTEIPAYTSVPTSTPTPAPTYTDVPTDTPAATDTPVPTETDSRIPGKVYGVVDVKGDVGTLVRIDPSFSGMVICAVYNGEYLEITGRTYTENGLTWVTVRTAGGHDGWAYKPDLKIDEPKEEPAPAVIERPEETEAPDPGDLISNGTGQTPSAGGSGQIPADNKPAVKATETPVPAPTADPFEGIETQRGIVGRWYSCGEDLSFSFVYQPVMTKSQSGQMAEGMFILFRAQLRNPTNRPITGLKYESFRLVREDKDGEKEIYPLSDFFSTITSILWDLNLLRDEIPANGTLDTYLVFDVEGKNTDPWVLEILPTELNSNEQFPPIRIALPSVTLQ